ncbi:MAG TPA: peptidoglycan-associated lipoprotein Pal [Burkholderiales bacterium]|nr:peptidoglycan-associated lipoprotein Pal [Burkholderiales bacterium]
MNRSPFTSLGRLPAALLLCAVLAACSTTQKSGAGSGTQDAAPIAEAGKTESGKPADAVTSSAGGTASASAPATATTTPAAGGAAAAQPAAKGDEEAARLKQQLADQEAEINRMREEQVNAQRLAEEEAARRHAEEAAASSAPGTASQQGSAAAAAGAGAAAPAAGGATSGASGSSSTAASGQAGASDAPMAGQPLQRSIYFEYDSSAIPEQYDSMIVGHAAFLKAHPDYSAEVQGNCDERGSREYNLALGARRAESVKRALELAGADGSKIKTVSFGAEKPVAFGQDEASYRQNRRADIQY